MFKLFFWHRMQSTTQELLLTLLSAPFLFASIFLCNSSETKDFLIGQSNSHERDGVHVAVPPRGKEGMEKKALVPFF